MSVIEFAEKRLEEEAKERNDENVQYWAAYLDGAKAQLKEDLKALVEYDKHIREKHETEFRNKYRRALYDEALYDGRIANAES